jgi:hypothetical protein
MKHIFISALAVAAFGVAFAGTTSAEATEGWQSSGWVNGSGNFGFTTQGDGYSVTVTNNFFGTTRSVNTTGGKPITGQTNANCTAQVCPTTHWAWALCSDQTFFTGNMVSGSSPNSSASQTNVSGYGSGYFFSNGSAEASDPGFCPFPTTYQAGGVWVYNY